MPYENDPEAFVRAGSAKIERYLDIVEELRGRNYGVALYPFIVGSLGSWDPGNVRALRALGMPPRQQRKLAKACVVAALCADPMMSSGSITKERISARGTGASKTAPSYATRPK